MVRFRDMVACLRSRGVGKVSEETVKELEVSYSHMADSKSSGKSIDGIIAYSCREVLDKIMQSLAE